MAYSCAGRSRPGGGTFMKVHAEIFQMKFDSAAMNNLRRSVQGWALYFSRSGLHFVYGTDLRPLGVVRELSAGHKAARNSHESAAANEDRA